MAADVVDTYACGDVAEIVAVPVDCKKGAFDLVDDVMKLLVDDLYDYLGVVAVDGYALGFGDDVGQVIGVQPFDAASSFAVDEVVVGAFVVHSLEDFDSSFVDSDFASAAFSCLGLVAVVGVAYYDAAFVN